MKKEYIDALKLMAAAHIIIDVMEEFKGSSAYKQRLKQTAKRFVRELDVFLNTAYEDGSTDTTLIELIEACQKSVENLIEKQVEVID